MIARIQAQLHYSASQNYEAVTVPPFTCYFNPDSPSPWNNYAIPTGVIVSAAELRGPLDALCTLYQQRARQPRFEFIAEAAPGLAPALAAYGFVEEAQTLLMLCTPASQQRLPPVTGLQLAALTVDDGLALIQELLTVQRRAFGDSTAFPATQEEAVTFRRRFATTQLYVAQIDGQVVSAASLLPPHAGITEIAGIGTLADYRRRGIGAALTAYAVQQAFAQGLEGVFLTAADAAAGRVYTRVGFHPIGMGLAYSLPER